MSQIVEQIDAFLAYAGTLAGDEKGEAQVYCDRLFQAFGHKGYKEAGATLEDRIKTEGKGTSFADLVWKPRVLIEMKKRGEKLGKHYDQAFNYWLNAVPDRPRYVVLCNFDEFWISLNAIVAQYEDDEIEVQGPGLPKIVENRAGLVTDDAVGA
jgi:hypothetical protein